MKRTCLLVIGFFIFSSLIAFAAPRTLRVDYYHGGNSHDEWFTVDRTVLEPLEWPGNPAKAIDDSQLGNYLFEVREQASGKLLYSRGFSSVFAEWKTTDEARQANRTFSESLRFPAPNAPVQVVLKERNEKNPAEAFREVWKTMVDPKDKFVDRSRPPSPGTLITLQKMAIPPAKSISWYSATATPQPSGRSLNPTRTASWKRFSQPPLSRSTGKISTYGACARRRKSRAYRALPAESTVARHWARAMTRLTASVMC